ncbi:hypothetical protein CHS0354_043148 [Potamilus streckersoni]|uniref:Integrase zinc-binding domain-containing protein n=1 Tax=Potamilus streckersoni TaxID=2493646 RepID=A0AAE0SC65_9BIVA|nr:hypothetical protein CHS0354_043148 [Potamilus streckersoni]
MDAQSYHELMEYLTKKTYPKRMKLEWKRNKPASVERKRVRGSIRNYKKKKERYFSKGLFEKVEKYVENCDVCQREASLKKTKKPLHPIQVPDAAFSKIGIDLIGPLRLEDLLVLVSFTY